MTASTPFKPCFTIQGVSKTYRSPDGTAVMALRSFRAVLPWGARVGILGHSGAGKSTLLHLLGLLDDPDTGTDPSVDILFHDDRETLSYFGRTGPGSRPLDASGCDRLKKQQFGFVFQSGHLLRHLSATENVALKLMLAGRPRRERQEQAHSLLGQLDLDHRRDHRAYQLSGGEAQRVAVLRALASSPRVVFADEPTGNLDRANADAVLGMLRSWQEAGTTAQPRTLLLVTHQLDDAWRHCTHFLVLQRTQGQPPVWRTREELQEQGGFDALVRLLREEPAKAEAPAAGPVTPPAPVPGPTTSEPSTPPESAVPTGPSTPAAPTGNLRWRDYLGLAWGDLTRKEHRGTTLANGFVLFFLLLLSLIGLALQVGMNQLVQDRLQTLEATSFVIDGLGTVDGYVTDQLTAELNKLTLDGGNRPAFPPDLGGVHRFNVPSRQFYTYRDDDSHGPLSDRPVRGRTALPGDPDLLALLPQGFSGVQADEIIVTSRFLTEELKAPTDARFVWIETGSEPRKLKIMAVTEKLRDGAAYLLPDGFLQLLQSGKLNAEKLAKGIALGNISDPITLRAKILADNDLVERLNGSNLELETEPTRLILRLKDGQAQRKNQLEGQGNFWRRLLAQRTWITVNQTTVEHLPTPVIELPPATFSKATLRVRHTRDLPEIDRQLRPLGLSVPTDVMNVLNLLRNTIEPLTLMIWIIVLSALVVGVLNLAVTMHQMVREKRVEIGILKAHGMTTGQLGWLYALEGLLLLGVSAGLAWGVGLAVSGYLNSTPLQKDWPALIHFGSLTVTLTALLAVVLGPIVCWLATLLQARKTPREAMS